MSPILDHFYWTTPRAEGWKEVKIGAIFEAYVTGQSGQVRGRSQSYVMHLGGPEGFGVKLAMEAQARRWLQAAQSAVVGDGAAWIWNLAARDYPVITPLSSAR